MIKTATFEALLDSLEEKDDGYIFKLEGKEYCIQDRDEVREIAEKQHGYIIIY